MNEYTYGVVISYTTVTRTEGQGYTSCAWGMVNQMKIGQRICYIPKTANFAQTFKAYDNGTVCSGSPRNPNLGAISCHALSDLP